VREYGDPVLGVGYALVARGLLGATPSSQGMVRFADSRGPADGERLHHSHSSRPASWRGPGVGAHRLVVSCPAAVGAAITFGTPTAASTFGQNIIFTQPYSGATVESASILVKTPDQYGPAVVAIASPGSSSLVFKMDTSSGGLYPFDPVTAYFELVLTDGTDGRRAAHQSRLRRRPLHLEVEGRQRRHPHYIQASDSFAQQMVNEADARVDEGRSALRRERDKAHRLLRLSEPDGVPAGVERARQLLWRAVPSFRSCYAVVGPTDTAYAAEVMPMK